MTGVTPPLLEADRSSRLSEPTPEPERRKMHLRPVWIVLDSATSLSGADLLLLPRSLAPSGEETDSFLPTTSYALRAPADQSRSDRLCRSCCSCSPAISSRPISNGGIDCLGRDFARSWWPPSSAFRSFRPCSLALVASGLVNKAVDVWFSDQIEQVMRDSYDVARMQHAGHITLAVNSARAISHEIIREDMLLTEQRDLLVAAMARKRAEFGVAGIEVFSAKMETLTKSLDLEVPSAVLDLPIGQLVLQVINGKQEVNAVQEAQTGALGASGRSHRGKRAGRRDRRCGGGGCLRARIVAGQDGRDRPPVRRIQADQGHEKSNQGRSLSVRRRHHGADSVRGDLVWILRRTQHHGADPAIG